MVQLQVVEHLEELEDLEELEELVLRVEHIKTALKHFLVQVVVVLEGVLVVDLIQEMLDYMH